MAKYQRRSQAEWQCIIDQQKASGLNVAAYCQQQNLSSKTFYKRRRGLCVPPDSELGTAPFIKITPPSNPVSVADEVAGVLHYPNSRLFIRPGCDVQWLAQLMQALS